LVSAEDDRCGFGFWINDGACGSLFLESEIANPKSKILLPPAREGFDDGGFNLVLA
jgi:hypothetical protein